MAKFALTNYKIMVGALDESCFSSDLTITRSGDAVEVTNGCSSGWREFVPGLSSWEMTFAGPQDFAASSASTTYTPDEYLTTAVTANYPVLVAPSGAAEGVVAYASQGLVTQYTPVSGSVGSVGGHNLSVVPYLSTPLVRGVYATQQTVTANANGTGHQVGAVSASQRVYAGVHFLTAGGTTPSVTVILESDDNSGFSSATTRATFTAQTARGAQWTSVAGAITDTYWRFRFSSVSGTSPSFQVRGFIGIQ